MNFKKWFNLQEVGTGTNSIAVFARPIMHNTMSAKSFMPINPLKNKKRSKKY